MRPRVVLVTGVSRYLGTRLASCLAADPSIERIIGVDTVPPRAEALPQLGRTEFVRADIRNPLIAKVIASCEVDTVVHMNVIATPLGAGGRTAMKEINVIGTMQLLAACQKAPSMRRLVVKSTTAVYGASPRDPALFTEDVEPRSLPKSGYAKDAVEVEGYVRGFGRRRPDVTLSLLRFTNFIGATIETPLTRYFSLPVVPTVLGFDPRIQLCHEDDGIEVLRRCTLEDHPGIFNVGGTGVLLLRLWPGPLPGWATAAYGGAVLLGLAALAVGTLRRPGTMTVSALWLTAATMAALSPHYPWYLTALAVPTALAPRLTGMWLMIAAPLLYLDPYHEHVLWPALLFLPALLTLAVDLSRRSLPKPT